MDKCGTDAEFDSYWDHEAKNQNRNRIRVGRQYQATIPSLLKPGQKDGRKSEELETLKWKPDQISDQAIEEYLSMAKGLGLFSKSLDSPKPSEKSDNSLQSAIKGLSEFVTSHHPCHHDDGCKVPQPSSSGESSSKPAAAGDWSPSEAQLFAQALEACGKNFGAIKKDYLPWKPIKSIIEYYYEGKGEKAEELSEACASAECSPKKESSPSPSCSKDEKPFVKEESSPCEAKPEPFATEDPPKDSMNFLENARVTDPCKATLPDMKMSLNKNDAIMASPTVGSLNFFLGGRLVLKLNAQQDSGSGTKCQWVQSNDLPKHPNSIKKERQRKKCTQEGSFTPNIEPHRPKKSTDQPSRLNNDCDPSAVKKPRLKSEYDFSENDKQGMLLCSSYWTPPVADGQEAIIEVDDGSSKTSEGYISPVLSNPRFPKAENYNDSSSVSPIHSNSRFSRTEHEREGYASPVLSRFPKAESYNDSSSMSPNLSNSRFARTDYLNDSKSSEGYISPILSNSRHKVADHSNSELAEENDSASKNVLAVRNSPSRGGSDGSSPYKQEVLNHKSALSHNRTSAKSVCYQPRASHSSGALLKQWNKWPSVAHSKRTSSPCSLSPVSVVDLKSPLKENPLDLSSRLDTNAERDPPRTALKADSESESGAASCCEFSPQSSNVDSPHKEPLNKCPEDQCCEGCNANSDCSPGKEDNSESSYTTYCNLPYRCALPKCTKDYSSFEEVPLDLSSANDSLKEKTVDSEKISETVDATITENSAATAVEKGMLYQLLKNKVSK